MIGGTSRLSPTSAIMSSFIARLLGSRPTGHQDHRRLLAAILPCPCFACRAGHNGKSSPRYHHSPARRATADLETELQEETRGGLRSPPRTQLRGRVRRG